MAVGWWGGGGGGGGWAPPPPDSGASVIVLEADDKVGGSSRLSGGHFYAAGTSVQREAGILDDTPDDMFNYYMTLNQWNVEPAVARTYCDSAAPTFEWLRSLGVEYKPERVYISGIDTVARGHPPEGEGLAVVRVLDSERIKRGVDMALMTRADKLIEEDGEIVGVAAGDQEVGCGAVVIASGGFGHNKEFIEKYWPDAHEQGDGVWAISGPKAMGDGIVLGEQVGATLGGHNRGLLLVTPGFNRDLELGVPPWSILVSREGRRFASEMAPYTVMAGLFKRNGGMAYAIFDEAARLEADAMPAGPSWTSENLLAKAESGEVLRADTLEELAALCKINPAPLAGTVQKYNEDCARGVDTAYFKPMGLRPIETPPFYAVEVRPAIIAWTGCGLRVDPDTHVIANNELPIDNLFAAGEAMGTLHGDRYIGGGGSYGPAVTFGRIAGRNAATAAAKSAGLME
ncbi:MAG: FAD-binding protein [Dehalococcoidia bacterium]|nr:FAD-binding protein [Dehalococcoidia bacterium]